MLSYESIEIKDPLLGASKLHLLSLLLRTLQYQRLAPLSSKGEK
jgi:hypothetical protein